MKWWFKVNQNKLYRKYEFDPHGFLIRKGKLTRSFKFLLLKFNYTILKKIRNGFYARGLCKKNILLNQMKKKTIPSNNELKRFKTNKKYKNIKLNSWKNKFWNKFQYNYYNWNKKKYSLLYIKKTLIKRRVSKYKKIGYYNYKFRIYKKKKRKRLKTMSLKREMKNKRKRLMNRITWLHILKIRRKKKTWWLLRIAQKKIAYFYGIKKLQKLRYINRLNNKTMPLKTYYNIKLECMLNVVLFRLNVFDNIYITNNFIRVVGFLVNNLRVIYPFRYIKVNDILSFPAEIFKKMFFIFVKRCKFNKSYLRKKIFFRGIGIKKIKTINLIKNFVNVPQYIEYNYKIMHFMIWRLPNKGELITAFFKKQSKYNWAFSTQLQYN